jgi:hypothetical protein
MNYFEKDPCEQRNLAPYDVERIAHELDAKSVSSAVAVPPLVPTPVRPFVIDPLLIESVNFKLGEKTWLSWDLAKPDSEFTSTRFCMPETDKFASQMFDGAPLSKDWTFSAEDLLTATTPSQPPYSCFTEGFDLKLELKEKLPEAFRAYLEKPMPAVSIPSRPDDLPFGIFHTMNYMSALCPVIQRPGPIVRFDVPGPPVLAMSLAELRQFNKVAAYWLKREKRLFRSHYPQRLLTEAPRHFHGATGDDQRYSKWLMARERLVELADHLLATRES